VQAEPLADGGVYAYTVTYWAKGRAFPFGAYTNDVPDETALYFPDSLREALTDGHRPALIEAVVHGSPADRAGLRDGELIVAVDGASFAGCDGLDAIVAERANEEVTLKVWSATGMRETTCTFGERFVNADGFGVEGLYYNQPWAFEDYANFQKYSQMFTQAWHDGWDAYHAEQERQRQASWDAYQSSRIASLNDRITDLENRPSQRTSRELRIGDLTAQGARNWEDFKQDMDWD
jgi:hypothetical protein